MVPSDFGGGSCCNNALLNIGLKIFDDLGPDFLYASLDFADDCLTACSAFITSLKKLAVLIFTLSISCLVDHVSVLLDEGLGGSIVPIFDLSLDIVQLIDHESFFGQGLTHVTIACSDSSLLNSVSCAEEGSSNHEVSSHYIL
jgi:hypothetical protein